jgi:hypothetical protein
VFVLLSTPKRVLKEERPMPDPSDLVSFAELAALLLEIWQRFAGNWATSIRWRLAGPGVRSQRLIVVAFDEVDFDGTS